MSDSLVTCTAMAMPLTSYSDLTLDKRFFAAHTDMAKAPFLRQQWKVLECLRSFEGTYHLMIKRVRLEVIDMLLASHKRMRNTLHIPLKDKKRKRNCKGQELIVMKQFKPGPKEVQKKTFNEAFWKI